MDDPAKLILIGGFAGTGKTTVSRRLAADLGVPRLGSDTIGRTVRASVGAGNDNVDAYRVAYDVLFALTNEFIQAGVSTMLDMTMGWEFQWLAVDEIRDNNPATIVVPLILSCPRSVCMARITSRHAADPDRYDPPDLYTTSPKIVRVWEYLAALDRPDVQFVDANRPEEVVYDEVRAGVGEFSRGATPVV